MCKSNVMFKNLQNTSNCMQYKILLVSLRKKYQVPTYLKKLFMINNESEFYNQVTFCNNLMFKIIFYGFIVNTQLHYITYAR